ncbi:MAG TPA: sorbosone dehydrogenase family protein [Rhizomicrobium sp.]|nr:sorbosone dehydrogenase family protein [Rhizomicrobium sp.]
MTRSLVRFAASCLVAVVVGGAGSTPRSSTGASPQLPAPESALIPALNFSSHEAWPKGNTPVAPKGFTISRYASLDHPRWMYVLPNGDVLVSQARTIRKADETLRDRFEVFLQRKTNVVGQSPNRITLLRDSNKDGVVDQTFDFLSVGLDRPFGMLLLNGRFYVADTGSVRVYPYREGQTAITAAGKKILDLPVGGYNNHWTRNLLARADGKKIYVTVGSGSNAGEHGVENEKHRANVLEINPDGTGLRIFASGIRNPNGLAYEPQTGALWTVVNERDFLGPDLVPDYLTRVRDGDFYGWPWAYWGKHADAQVTPARADLVAKSLTPDYALGAHVAALGLAFYTGDAFAARYQGGAFIGEHGSWNRTPAVGYKVAFVPFKNGMPSGPPEDFLTGFTPKDGVSYGRPVGVVMAPDGALLVADDTGGVIWRVGVKKP